MNSFVKRYRREIITLSVFAFFYFVIRLYHITSLPIFTDEAIYLRWTQIAKDDASWRFISLTDGKQPMFVWVAMVFFHFFNDPLLAGRLVSVGAGLLSMIGLFFLGSEIFRDRRIGLLSSFLYLISPFTLVYDRMALYDSMVGAFAVWALYVEILLVRRLRLDIAFIAGLVVGGGVLTKTNAFFNIYLLPVTLILFDYSIPKWFGRLVKWIGLAILVVILTYAYYSVLRLSPYYHIVNEKNAEFVFPLSEWFKHPLEFFWGNLVGEWDWLWHYITFPLLIIGVLSFGFSWKYLKEKILLFLWFFIPFIALAFFGKVLYSRFILPMVLSLFPLIAYSLYQFFTRIKNKKVYAVLFLLAISWSLWMDFLILTDFANAPIPYTDVTQYNNDWPSGGGIREAVALFENESKSHKIYIGTQGTFGLLPFAFEIYLNKNPNIKIVGYWPIEEEIPKDVLQMSKKMPVYFVFYQPCYTCHGGAPKPWPVTIVYRYEHVLQNRFFTVYRVTP